MATRITYTDAGNQTQEIVFDATVNETSTSAAEVTEHPIEQGSNIADHVRKRSDALKLEVVATDYPITAKGRGIGAAATPGRAAQIRSKLEGLQKDGVLLIVESGAKLYANQVLKEIGISRDKAIAGALRFTLQFVEMRIVTTETVPVATRAAQPGTDQGKKTGKSASEADKKKSWAASAKDKAPEALKALKNLIGGGS